MKTFFKILLSLAVLFLWQGPVLARDNVSDWYVKDFQTEITVNSDSSLNITEKILADCGKAPNKHGIFRVFPKNYQTKDGNFILPFELLSITNGEGKSLDYSVVSDNNTITYKIGDSNVDVSGDNFYEIKYRVKNVIRHENQNFDELYYNILGNFWDLDIDKFTAQINFPSEINKDNTEVYYYSGMLGSKNSNLVTGTWTENNTLKIASQRSFLKNEGVTVSVSFPKNIISSYVLTFKDKYGFSVSDMIISLGFFILTFFICFYVWKKYGRESRLNKTIVPEFEIPDNLTPIEMGGIMKKGALHNNGVTATIIRLGFLGYLTITKEEQKNVFVGSDFKLSRTDKVVGAELYEAEKFILDKIFKSKTEINLKDLKNNFYKDLPEISKIISTDLRGRGFIDVSGEKYGIVMFITAGILFFSAFIFSYSIIILSSFLMSASVVLIFAFLMSKLTVKGAELELRIKGFKLYMNTAEKYRSRFQEQTGELDKLLPYAILFGITKEWLKKMKDIYGEDYFSTYHPVFMIGVLSISDFSSFSESLNAISEGIASNISPSSSGAGGGGFSGGGAGGGGGGGW